MRTAIDLNCDLGESFGPWRHGADEQLLPRITTASVACGFHAGDPLTMRTTVALAAKHSVAVGAHPGLPDLLGFGRRALDVSSDDLHAMITYQAGALEAFLRAAGMTLRHVKPHGVLYPMLNARRDLAEATIDAIAGVMHEPVLYWPGGSDDKALLRAAAARGVRVVREFYPDSRYGSDGETIVERERAPMDPDAAGEALRRWLSTGEVVTVDGATLAIEAESLCVHGDGPTAVAIIDRVHEVLTELEVPFRSATAEDQAGLPR